MIRKSGSRFSEKIMLHQKIQSMIPKKPAPDLIRGGIRFSEKIMLKQDARPQSAMVTRPRLENPAPHRAARDRSPRVPRARGPDRAGRASRALLPATAAPAAPRPRPRSR